MSHREPFDPKELKSTLWEVMDRLQGDLARLELAVEGLNQGALGRLGWMFEVAGSALTDKRFRDHMAPDVDEAEEQAIGQWVVTQGRDKYMQVWGDPSLIPERCPRGDPVVGFLGKLWLLYEERFGDFMPPLPRDF